LLQACSLKWPPTPLYYLLLGNLPFNEKTETVLESLDSGFDSQSMDVDEENRLEEGIIGDKCGKRLSPNAPTSSPELLQAVKKSRENTEVEYWIRK
jgi:hypothetical protein